MSKASFYRPDIDGLRAIAVLSVLFFHADLGCSGGFVGVDVFFVVSGYLITGLILKDIDAGRFGITQFWERRIRRILPALSIVVLFCLAMGWFFFSPLDYRKLGQSAFAQALLVSNIFFWQTAGKAGYFDESSVEITPLLHTWSLAVEEQFYLLFPFLLLACRGFSRRRLARLTLVLGAISLGLSVYCSYYYRVANFYLLPTRAWELLIGAWPAIVLSTRDPARWLKESVSWAGLAAILAAIFLYNRETRFPGITALPPCVGAALIIWANRSSCTSVGKILAWPPLVYIGLISYSLYLWHWPLLAFGRYLVPGPLSVGERGLLLLIGLVLAALSLKFVETPFRQRSVCPTRMAVLPLPE
jgi:peptidoglycan/LPS O-acetylase OafA/YrhL